MYLRLAFAVAAFLEPEILIVDEVLAVGDAEFQQKCLGRMGEVAKEGRTVLFVSHNMGAVRALCTRAILMKGGSVALDGKVESVVGRYLSEDHATDARIRWAPDAAPRSKEIRFVGAAILNDRGEPAASLDCRKGFKVEVEYEVLQPLNGLRIGFFMQNMEGVPICGSNDPAAWPEQVRRPGLHTSRCEFPGYTLNAGRYSVHFGADLPPYASPLGSTPFCIRFAMEDVEGHGPSGERLPGVLRPKLRWDVQRLVGV
jgi:lipopolysaccharide transport system ATP-binding protein